MDKLIARLYSGKQLTYKEIISLALNVGYKSTNQSGSHEKYEREGSPQLSVVASVKRANALHQYRTEKILRDVYKGLEAK